MISTGLISSLSVWGIALTLLTSGRSEEWWKGELEDLRADIWLRDIWRGIAETTIRLIENGHLVRIAGNCSTRSICQSFLLLDLLALGLKVQPACTDDLESTVRQSNLARQCIRRFAVGQTDAT